MKIFDQRLENMFDRYVILEKEIQRYIDPLSRHYCRECAGKCCREEICRESIESAFLSVLVERQRIQYDHRDGWFSDAGCRLDYGRPVVCYAFFCEEVMKSHVYKTYPIQTMVNEFVSIGNKVHGNTHLECISNLELLSPQKIEKLCKKIDLMIDKMVDHRARSGTLPIGQT
jgi:hypothetical protein